MNLLQGERPIQGRPYLSISRVFYMIAVIPVALTYLTVATIIRELFIGGPSALDMVGRFWKRGERKAGLVQRGASKTAVMVALVRYVGYFEGWTNDSMSRHFLPYELAKAVEFSKLFEPQYPLSLKLSGQLMTRTLAGDRLILNGKPKQVVLLGAGLDTRAHRLQVDEACRFYEVDIATTQALKKQIVNAHLEDFKNRNVRYVTVDFSKERFMEKLVSDSDFDPTCAETVVLFEGVSMYLPWPALEDTLQSLARGLAKGSLIGMDVMEDIFSLPEARARNKLRESLLVHLVSLVGEPFQWGVPLGKTVDDVFKPLDFEIAAEVTSEDMERDFLRVNGSSEPFARVPKYWHYLVLRVK